MRSESMGRAASPPARADRARVVRQNPPMDATEVMRGWVPVRRAADGELSGYVRAHDGAWDALTVFGGVLGRVPTEADAAALVARDGIPSLGRRWYHRAPGSTGWQAVLIQEAWPGRARGVIGWYALPGAEPFSITAAELAAGHELVLDPPDGAPDGPG